MQPTPLLCGDRLYSDFLCGQRIVIVGTSGSGKTTLAKRFSQQWQLPHVELDALHWQPNWTPAAPDTFRTSVLKALSGDRWVTDGNYSIVRDITWSRADTLIWLDYSFWLVFGRILQRTLWRSFRQAELWNGNRETWAQAFSSDSMILWTLKTYWRRRRDYPALLQQPEYKHLKVLRLSSPRMVDRLTR